MKNNNNVHLELHNELKDTVIYLQGQNQANSVLVCSRQ